jgi:hypothetical protein
MKDLVPSFTDPAMTPPEEEENEMYPTPDGGPGRPGGLPKRPGFQRGIGLPQPPSAGPDGPRPEEAGLRSPGDPVNPGPDDPRFSAPTPPTPPGEPESDGLTQGATAFMSPTGPGGPLGPDGLHPAMDSGGDGPDVCETPPPPPPDKSEEPPR